MRIEPPPRSNDFRLTVFLRNGGGCCLSIFFFVISENFFSEKTQKKIDVYAFFVLFFPRRKATNQPTNQQKKMKNITLAIINKKNGAFQSVTWKSEKTAAAAHKKAGIMLATETTATVRAGLDFANLASEKEREEIGALPWGEWENFPHTLTHKGERYVRLYPSGNASTKYFVNGAEVTREYFQSFQRPSDISDGSTKKCFNVKESNLIEA